MTNLQTGVEALDRRELIAELEAETACANRELQELGAWQFDHGAEFDRLNKALELLTKGRGGV